MLSTALNTAYFSVASSAHVPAATPFQVRPLELTETEYRPTFPLRLPSWRGRYARPETWRVACMSTVRRCGSGGTVPAHAVDHTVSPSPSRTFLTGCDTAWLSVDTVQPVRGRAGPIFGSPSRPISATEVYGPR